MANVDLGNPEMLKTLLYLLGGVGSTIGGNQGVAGFLGGFTQKTIASQNLMNLIKTLSGEPTTPSALGTVAAGGGTARAPKTEGVGTVGAGATGEGARRLGSQETGKAIPSKITFEGSQLSDIGKILSGINIQETPLSASAPNFLLPR